MQHNTNWASTRDPAILFSPMLSSIFFGIAALGGAVMVPHWVWAAVFGCGLAASMLVNLVDSISGRSRSALLRPVRVATHRPRRFVSAPGRLDQFACFSTLVLVVTIGGLLLGLDIKIQLGIIAGSCLASCIRLAGAFRVYTVEQNGVRIDDYSWGKLRHSISLQLPGGRCELSEDDFTLRISSSSGEADIDLYELWYPYAFVSQIDALIAGGWHRDESCVPC